MTSNNRNSLKTAGFCITNRNEIPFKKSGKFRRKSLTLVLVLFLGTSIWIFEVSCVSLLVCATFPSSMFHVDRIHPSDTVNTKL